ncbi:MAG: DUF169 domain-containing protein [Deltaproteobacteria bacterium]|jgi:hypothetical protein|nr:DUF169 domain-containing protein [Deltaproteobacteria bacterium]
MPKKPSGGFRMREALELDYPILGLWYEDKVPSNAATLIAGRSRAALRGCALFLISRAFSGDVVAFTPQSALCPGASSGLGLPPNPAATFPGGVEAYYRFLANGNECTSEGRAEAERMRSEGIREAAVNEYLQGEGFKQNFDLAVEYFQSCYPPLEPETGVIMLRPLSPDDLDRPPKVALMLADALQLSALVVLVNFARPGLDNVRIPLAAGCASLAALPLYEASQENPKAIVGLVDVASRRNMRRVLQRKYLSMSLPWSLFIEMERNVDSSFLGRPFWKNMLI